MKKIIFSFLITFICVYRLNASEAPQPIKAADSWEDFWQQKLNEADQDRVEGKFSNARRIYEHLLTSHDQTIPPYLRLDSRERLLEMLQRQEPMNNILRSSEKEDEKKKDKQSSKLFKKIELADEKWNQREYDVAKKLYKEVLDSTNNTDYHAIAGLVIERLNERFPGDLPNMLMVGKEGDKKP